MDISIKNGRILAILGCILIIPYTTATVLGIGFFGLSMLEKESSFFFLFPLIAWGMGFMLFRFYFRHGLRRKPYTEKQLLCYWLYSIIYNALPILIFIGSIGIQEFAILSLEIIREFSSNVMHAVANSELWDLFTSFDLFYSDGAGLWVLLLLLHIALSGESIYYLFVDKFSLQKAKFTA